jgi:hypothetical protein
MVKTREVARGHVIKAFLDESIQGVQIISLRESDPIPSRLRHQQSVGI